jgi:hypothetical protein
MVGTPVMCGAIPTGAASCPPKARSGFGAHELADAAYTGPARMRIFRVLHAAFALRCLRRPIGVTACDRGGEAVSEAFGRR